jgi:hypothetical protein
VVGTTTIYYHSVDNAGNTEETKTVEIYITPPSISLVEKNTSTTSTYTTSPSHRKTKPRPSDPEEHVSQGMKIEPVVVQKVEEVEEQEAVLLTDFVKVEEGLLEKSEINDIAEETPIESLYPAAVLESAQNTDARYEWVILIIILVLIGLVLIKKRHDK